MALFSCRGAARDPPAVQVVRLVDLFPSAVVSGDAGAPSEIPPTEWRFDGGDDLGWKAGVGVTGLQVRDGRLAGTTTTDFPIIHVERMSGLDEPDVLHSVEVRARVSKGGNLEMIVLGTRDLNIGASIRRAGLFGWPFKTPVVPGDAFQTYTITDSDPRIPSFAASDTRHVLLRPLDQAGAEFEIESIRLVFRKEHLQRIPSGVSWQGFGDVYRESIVTRSPETARFDVELPSRPWLDLSVGTVEEGPVTFLVEVDQRGEKTRLLEKTVTTAHRWEPAPVALDQFASRRVTVSLSISAKDPGALGFWGAPAVRDRARPPQTTGRHPPQGVILFVADTLRRDHLKDYGYARDTAPHLSRLVSEGTLFLDNQSQGTWTKVSVPSILTSLYPTTHGIRTTTDRLPASATTLAELYRQAGYATLSFSSTPFTGKGTNLHQGFEELHERTSLTLPDGVSPSKTGRGYLDRLLPWIEAHRDQPFFILFHAMDPHSPFEPYAPYDGIWAKAGAKADHESETERVLPFIKSDFMRQQRLPFREELEAAGLDPDRFVEREHDWYDGSIRALDTELGRLLEAIAQMGLSEEILIAFIADHGEEFLEHGRHWHGSTVYGEMTNVPLVLWAPGRVPAGTVVTETVQSIDLMPTLLDLSGLEVPEAAQGQSLVPLFTEGRERFRSRPAFSERFRYDEDRPYADSIAVVAEGFKLIHNLVLPEDQPDYPEWELFDHQKDPLNLVNIAGEHPEVVERLSRILEDWYKFAQAAKLPSDEGVIETLNPEELERLRSLGYVQ
jgi:arylsulfatase A-like enzyme